MGTRAFALFLLSCGLGSACTTIQFSESDRYQKRSNLDVWHSSLVFGLIEGEEPIDLDANCRNRKFKTLTTEHTLGASLLWSATFYQWRPIDVSILCE